MPVDREKLEEELTQHWASGSFQEVAAGVVRGFGPEIAGFLAATLKDENAAADVFSLFCEHVLKGAQGFRKQSSFRTWAYALARNAAYHYRNAEKRRARRELPWPEDSEMSRAIVIARDETARYLKTEVKSRLSMLRDALPEEDRMLLVLRVDRKLGFDDIARVLLDPEKDPALDVVKREAARLRKRFQAVKERLLEQGRKEGLLGDE